jgi:cytochrome P450
MTQNWETFLCQKVYYWKSPHQIHQNPTLWGEDAMEFNPKRFAKGVSKACQDPQGFIPFSFGPRYCIGQNLAMLQSKLIVAKMLSCFQLSVSPNYIHNRQ